MPAFQENIVDKLIFGAYPDLRSIAFCLEDSVRDEALARAEQSLHGILRSIMEHADEIKNIRLDRQLPFLFIRVRSSEHMRHIMDLYSDVSDLVSGYILPKFDQFQADEYLSLITEWNAGGGMKKYIMPVLESSLLAEPSGRAEQLCELREKLDAVKPFVLNVRVGGNDLCNLFGLRRGVDSTIYEIACVRDILTDVLSVFARDYVVSGPVWEYFGRNEGEPWAEGLRRELRADRACGFIGKTAIHPCQLSPIAESLKVSREDYEDAGRILFWREEDLGVEKSFLGNRMNELKCHKKWAKVTYLLGGIYGLK
jgi:citrate lyase beta subunit